MIIVSQDKDKIINYDNVQLLWINEHILNKTIKTFYIYADHDFLGEYETEERAKEVLQEIIKIYKVSKEMSFTIGDAEELLGEYENEVYCMPEK